MRVHVDTMTEVLDLTSPELAGYDLPEQYAILEHKYFLGIEMGFDPGLLVAIDSWESCHAACWRHQRYQADIQAQLAEIEQHRQWLADVNDCDVTWEAAARDWIVLHADRWRQNRQQLVCA